MKRDSWFPILVPAGIAAVMTPMVLLAASGSGGGFDAVVHGIESRYHVHANRIPFMGLISCVAGIATHGGAHGIHVAEIENFNGPVDGAELNSLVEQRVGQGWQPIIRETSRCGEDGNAGQTLIYARPDGSRLAMLIVDLDGKEMDVVQVSVDPDQLTREIGKYRHGANGVSSHEDSDRDGDPD